MNDKTPTITVNMDASCKGCGRKGATPCGLCLRCVAKAMRKGRLANLEEKIAMGKRKRERKDGTKDVKIHAPARSAQLSGVVAREKSYPLFEESAAEQSKSG